MTDTTWAPARIFLQREMGDHGSHTWCEDSIDECEQVEYVRVDAGLKEPTPAQWADVYYFARAVEIVEFIERAREVFGWRTE